LTENSQQLLAELEEEHGAESETHVVPVRTGRLASLEQMAKKSRAARFSSPSSVPLHSCSSSSLAVSSSSLAASCSSSPASSRPSSAAKIASSQMTSQPNCSQSSQPESSFKDIQTSHAAASSTDMASQPTSGEAVPSPITPAAAPVATDAQSEAAASQTWCAGPTMAAISRLRSARSALSIAGGLDTFSPSNVGANDRGVLGSDRAATCSSTGPTNAMRKVSSLPDIECREQNGRTVEKN
jgi:hypothetical protein